MFVRVPVKRKAKLSFPRRREPRKIKTNYCVYILASKRNGTLYVGVTNDLVRRVYEHKSNLVEGFTKRHGVHVLVHYKDTSDAASAIQREKKIKKWNRAWKIRLIEESNPEWRDLYDEIV